MYRTTRAALVATSATAVKADTVTKQVQSDASSIKSLLQCTLSACPCGYDVVILPHLLA